jgi:hypothetical protein
MKTTRKPSPIQTPAWANQFINLCGLLAETCSDSDAANQSAILALGCVADLGNVNGDAYTAAMKATREFVSSAAWDVRVRRAYNATPWRNDEFPASMVAVQHEANAQRAAARAALELALREFRPSLRLTVA